MSELSFSLNRISELWKGEFWIQTGQLARTKRQLQKAQREITSLHLARKPISRKLSQRFSWLQQQYQFLEMGVDTYRSCLHQISATVHPFAIDGSSFQTGGNAAQTLDG